MSFKLNNHQILTLFIYAGESMMMINHQKNKLDDETSENVEQKEE